MRNSIKFIKMHSLGNDFIMLDRITQNFFLNNKLITKLCHRNFGIGCDQLIIAEPPISTDADFFCRIYNSDGTEAKQCGNGLRCFAHYVRDINLTSKKRIIVETLGGKYNLHILDISLSSVNMGAPIIDAESVPIKLQPIDKAKYKTIINGKELEFYAVSVGNPHCIVIDKNNLSENEIIENLQNNKEIFPEGVNLSFTQIVDENNIITKVIERGAGPTLACGSGACASAIASIFSNKASHKINIQLPGGNLKVRWNEEKNHIILSGPVSRVFQGSYLLAKSKKKKNTKNQANNKSEKKNTYLSGKDVNLQNNVDINLTKDKG